jgi:glycosyltransferase involved in cell wall biosynthesis
MGNHQGGVGHGLGDAIMKIVHVINVDFAMQQFLLPLMRGARARGHEVIGVCAGGPLLASVRSEGFRILTVPLVRRVSPVSQYLALRELVAILRREQPDLVHAHMPISGFLARVAARWVGGSRVVYTCHGYLFNQPGPWLRRFLSFVMEWIGGRLTDDYLTVSQEEARDARRLWIAREAVAVGNGRDPTVFRPNTEARLRLRAELCTDPGRPVVIVVARLVRHKGYPELLEAMRKVDAELWVVGERLASDRGEDLEPLFITSGLGDRLRRLGHREDVAALLAAADVFALPSHFEGLPMSIIEAMLTGLPVVSTAIKGPREQVVHGVTGLLVPPGTVEPLAQALASLTRDPALRARMGAVGRERAIAHFNERSVVGRTLDLLRL